MMSTSTFFILFGIGLTAGILSGFVGVGGGIIIVPALVFFAGMSQYAAQGTSLFVLMMPVVLLGTINYWKSGNVNWKFGLVIASTFVIGGYVGSKLALKINPNLVKIIFGFIMAFVSIKLIMNGFSSLNNES